MIAKRVIYVIFFTNQGPAIQITVPKSKSFNAMFYKGKVLHKLKKYLENRPPATSLRHVRLLHDNASSIKANIVHEREYLNRASSNPLIRRILYLATFSYFRG
jgi:hypothetical protein